MGLLRLVILSPSKWKDNTFVYFRQLKLVYKVF